MYHQTWQVGSSLWKFEKWISSLILLYDKIKLFSVKDFLLNILVGSIRTRQNMQRNFTSPVMSGVTTFTNQRIDILKQYLITQWLIITTDRGAVTSCTRSGSDRKDETRCELAPIARSPSSPGSPSSTADRAFSPAFCPVFTGSSRCSVTSLPGSWVLQTIAVRHGPRYRDRRNGAENQGCRSGDRVQEDRSRCPGESIRPSGDSPATERWTAERPVTGPV